MSKIVDSWFFDDIGIVKVYDEIEDKNKFYIGNTLGFGYNQEEDEIHIKNWGKPFFPESIR